MPWTFFNSSGEALTSFGPVTLAVTREGGQTSEGTSTSTSVADLITSSTLSVAVTEPYTLIGGGRRTSGAASADNSLGMKENSTTIWTATVGETGVWRSEEPNENASGIFEYLVSPRVTNYVFGNMAGQFQNFDTSGGRNAGGSGLSSTSQAAAHVTATITSIVITGIVANAAVTIGADELHVYSAAAS